MSATSAQASTTDQAAADQTDATKSAAGPAGTAGVLLTPPSSVGADEDRNAADQQRRENEAGQQGSQDASAAQQPPNNQADPTAAQGVVTTPTEAPTTTTKIMKSGVKRREKTKLLNASIQAKLVKQVLDAEESDYYSILGIQKGLSKEDIKKAYQRMSLMTDPGKTKVQKARQAHEKVIRAAKALETSIEYEENQVEVHDEDEMDIVDENPNSHETFLAECYARVRDGMTALMKDADDVGALALLVEINTQIEQELKANAFPDNQIQSSLLVIDDMRDLCRKSIPLSTRYRQGLASAEDDIEWDKLNTSLAALVDEHKYPSYFKFDKPPKDMTAATESALIPGQTLNGQPILGHRLVRDGFRFYVETQGPKGLPCCETRTSADLGRAAKAYLDWDKARDVTEKAQKYRKRDAVHLGEILHIACTPVKTPTLPKAGGKPRRPPADIHAMYKSKDTWMVWSDYLAMKGRGDAEHETDFYYRRRGIVPPWKIEPENFRTIVSNPKYKGAQTRSIAGSIENGDRYQDGAKIGDIEDLRKENKTLKTNQKSLEASFKDLTAMMGQLMNQLSASGGKSPEGSGTQALTG